MTNVIRLDGRLRGHDPGGTRTPSIGALRLTTGMEVDEFSDALSDEVGWPVPLFVYLQWEKDGADPPPTDVLDAARTMSQRRSIEPPAPNVSRRQFLGSIVGLSSLVAAGFAVPTQSFPSAVSVGGANSKWRASEQTATDLETLIASYRRAYAEKAAVTELLPGATGLLHLLIDMGRRDQWPAGNSRLPSLVGQTAVLTGLLHLMGHQDLSAARAHYNLALQAARDAEDWDLASYVLGSLAFHAVSAQRPADGRAIMDASWDLASRRANPRTRAWVAALASELHARNGDDLASRRFLAESFAAFHDCGSEPSWKGVGWFDETRLVAYEGGNLLLMGQYAAAEEHLRRSLERLEPTRFKHRSTLSADLALALLHRSEIDESCARANDALTLANAISHQESIDRVRRVHFRLMRWRTHPAVAQLTERLQAA